MQVFHIMVLICLSLTLKAAPLGAGEIDVTAALHKMESINGFPADEQLAALIPGFYQLPQTPDEAKIKSLFETARIASWSSSIAEYISLSNILFADRPQASQNALRKDFLRSRAVLERFQDEITQYVLGLHPGYLKNWAPLRRDYKGRGIRVAVFDVFDSKLLARQKKQYPKAKIKAPMVFGQPIELSHGNTVIDIILELAPEAEIIPVWSDAKSYAAAMQALVNLPNVDVVNMSRAFPENAITKSLDADFKDSLQRFTDRSILVKALGNTGTDLFGALNRRRAENGMGPVNNIASYDLKLIRDLYSDASSSGLEIFAVNLALFGDDIALTASVPGEFLPVQQRSLAVPAEGVFSPSTGTFESGSSFAAPQLSALCALLLEAHRSRNPLEKPEDSRRRVYQQLLQTAKLGDHKREEWGLGLPNID